jgi:hydrophobe/amphiphile efflux-1 (HAE1) family protein
MAPVYDLCIARPIGTSLLAAALFVSGLLAYAKLPVSPLPKVDFPTLQVSAALPGASPETMASAVATPLERRFGRIAGVQEMTSTSVLGATSLTLQFDLDRNVDAAARDVQAAINAAAADLPLNLPMRPTFRKVNPADAPILVLALTSETLSLAQLYDTANTVLAQRIAQVRGVGQVTVGGGQQPAVRVQAYPQALASRELTLADVRQALGRQTLNRAKGGLQGAHQAYALGLDDQLQDARGFSQIGLATSADALLRLQDVATVFDDVENNKVAAWLDQRRAILLIVRRQPDANIIDTFDRIIAVLPNLVASVSPAMQVNLAVDRAATIRAAVQDVQKTLLLTVLLVVCVVFAFLRNLRATCIPSVAVPLSLVGTFAAMVLLDYSLNNLSLMALTIATGFVVDDAIVVTENISRLLEQGMQPREAARAGTRQIAFTVVSITVSLLAVFIPLLFMGGLVGRLFREFSVTLSISVVISALVSLTVTPMLCAKFLRAPKRAAGGQAESTKTTGALQQLIGAADTASTAAVALYARGLQGALRHRAAMLLVTAATLALTVALFISSPKGLFPQQDTGLIIGIADGAQDVSFHKMAGMLHSAGKMVADDADVEHVVSFTGAGAGSPTNTGSLFIGLQPFAKQRATAEAVINRLRPQLRQQPGLAVYLQAAQDVKIGGKAARTQYQYVLQDKDLETLHTWAPRLLQRFKLLPQLTDVATDQQSTGLQLQVRLDRDAAARFGITPANLDDTLYDAFGQRIVATRFTASGPYRVILEAKPTAAQGPESLDDLFIAGPSSHPVPLRAVTHTQVVDAPLAINHQGQFPSITLSFNLAPGVALGTAVRAIETAQQEMGLPNSVQAGFAGTAQAFTASNRSQPRLILAALLTVYIVLGVLYESFIHPLTILSTLPAAGVGALLALRLCGTEFGVMALIGSVLLIGIVKKNAILIIDFATEARRGRKLTAEAAIVEACVLRFRPILMTTLAAFFGALPLALGQGPGAELRRPLGIALVGGLLVSQLLTLFTTPVVYLALDRFAAPMPRRKPTVQ